MKNISKLNEKQRKLIEDNYSLISYFYKKYFPSFEDYWEYKGLAHLAICKAAFKYDENKGEFGTIFYHTLRSEIAHYYTMNNYDVRKVNKGAISLNSAPNGYKDTELTIANIIPSTVNVEEEVVENVYWETQMNKQPDKSRKVIQMIRDGYLQKEIGDKYGMSRQNVSRYLMKYKASLGY